MSEYLIKFLLLTAATFQFIFAAHFGGSRTGNEIRLEDKNSISVETGNNEASEPVEYLKEWVNANRISPSVQSFRNGGRIEIECEAEGKPPPTIQWMKGGEIVAQDEANSINSLLTTDSTTGIAKVKSRLVWDCAKPIHQGTYTCVAQSGEQTAMSTPASIVVAGSSIGNLSSCRRSEIITRPPRITTWSPVILEVIGSDVILPCTAVGASRPGIFWLDSDNQVLSPRRLRFKVLNSGSLYIHNLRWEDMGGYTCVAQNDAGRDTASTFLYPVSE